VVTAAKATVAIALMALTKKRIPKINTKAPQAKK